jgi:hypothetical protein
LRLSLPQNSRGEGKIPFNHVCATRKTQFSNGSEQDFPFDRDLRRPTQTQSALPKKFSPGAGHNSRLRLRVEEIFCKLINKNKTLHVPSFSVRNSRLRLRVEESFLPLLLIADLINKNKLYTYHSGHF